MQNLGTSQINAGELSMSCVAKPGSGISNFSVSNGTAIAVNGFFDFNPATNTTLFPATGWVGRCNVSSPQNIIVLPQIRYPANSNASMYQAVPLNSPYMSLMYPNIEKRRSNGNATAISVQNFGPGSTDVTFFYRARCSGYSDVTVGPYSIAAGQVLDHNHRLSGNGSGSEQHNLPDGWCGSLTIVSNNQPIGGFGQVTDYINYSNGDTIASYTALTTHLTAAARSKTSPSPRRSR
jgi:hypothetical protein